MRKGHLHELDTRDLLAAQDTESTDKPPPVRLLEYQVRPLARVGLIVLLGRARLDQDLHLVGSLVNTLQCAERLFIALLGGQPPRRLGDDEREDKDHQGDDEDEGDGEAVRKGVGVVLGALADTGADHLYTSACAAGAWRAKQGSPDRWPATIANPQRLNHGHWRVESRTSTTERNWRRYRFRYRESNDRQRAEGRIRRR